MKRALSALLLIFLLAEGISWNYALLFPCSDRATSMQDGSDVADMFCAVDGGILYDYTAIVVRRLGEWIRDNHELLAALAIVAIAAFAFALWRTTRRLWELAENQRADAEKALKVQAEALHAAIVVADRSAKAAEDTAKVAERSLVDLERPYVYIFGGDRIEAERAAGSEAHVRYGVANYGRTPAAIDDLLIGIRTGKTGVPDDLLHGVGSPTLRQDPVIAPKERRDGIKEPLAEGVGYKLQATGEVVADIGPDEDLFFRIVVYYRGPFSAGHETSACWRLDRGSNRFLRFGGDKFNYTR